MTTTETVHRSGPARVRLKNGNTYVGHAVYDGRAVTVRGRLEVTALIHGQDATTYRERVNRTLPLTLIDKITWTQTPILAKRAASQHHLDTALKLF